MRFLSTFLSPRIGYPFYAVFLLFLVTACTDDTADITVQKSGEQLFREVVLVEESALTEASTVYADIRSRINGLDAEQQAAILEFNDQVIDAIRTVDPDYFSNFEQVVASKDPYAIERKIGEGGSIILTMIERFDDFDAFAANMEAFIADNSKKYDLDSDADIALFQQDIEENFPAIVAQTTGENPHQGLIIAGPVAIALAAVVAAVVVAAAAGVVTYAAVYHKVKFWPKPTPEPEPEPEPKNFGRSAHQSYQKEALIAAIINTYP